MPKIQVVDGKMVVHEAFAMPAVECAPQELTVQESGQTREIRKVIVDAIHEGMTKNYHQFTAKELKKAAKSWTNPYPKPVLKDHITSSFFGEGDTTPLGRVVEARIAPSAVQEGTDALRLTLHISDPEAMQKVDDQRYLTMSVGARVGKAKCSICNHDFLKDGEFCEHRRGKKYKGEVASWILEDIDFIEVSFVNVPADQAAQVIHVEPATVGEGVAQSMTDPTTVPTASLENDDALTVLETYEDIEETEDTEETTAVEETETTTDETGEETADEEQSTEVSWQEQYEALQASHAALEDKVEQLAQALETQKTEHETALASLQDEWQTLQTEAADTESLLMSQNVEMARMVREQMAERLADLKVLSSELTAEEWDEAYQSALSLTSRDLAGQLKDTLQKAMQQPTRTLQTVHSDGLATQTSFDITEDDGETSPIDEGKGSKDVSYDEYQETIIQGLLGRMFQ